jgi:hypothetical protein
VEGDGELLVTTKLYIWCVGTVRLWRCMCCLSVIVGADLIQGDRCPEGSCLWGRRCWRCPRTCTSWLVCGRAASTSLGASYGGDAGVVRHLRALDDGRGDEGRSHRRLPLRRHGPMWITPLVWQWPPGAQEKNFLDKTI